MHQEMPAQETSNPLHVFLKEKRHTFFPAWYTVFLLIRSMLFVYSLFIFHAALVVNVSANKHSEWRMIECTMRRRKERFHNQDKNLLWFCIIARTERECYNQSCVLPENEYWDDSSNEWSWQRTENVSLYQSNLTHSFVRNEILVKVVYYQ